jgi:N-acetylmuramate 1-kinase
MLLTAPRGASFTLTLPDEEATRRFATDLAGALEPGDLVTLSGDLGAGKTTFARALIRHLAGDETIEVPSPTFTFVQNYELPRFALVHADLYRVKSAAELAELGFDDVPDAAVVLVEWPDRAAEALPADRLDIAFTLAPGSGPNVRQVRYTGYGAFAARAERIALLRGFIDEAGFGEAQRRRMQGDASTRIFERLTAGNRFATASRTARSRISPKISCPISRSPRDCGGSTSALLKSCTPTSITA